MTPPALHAAAERVGLARTQRLDAYDREIARMLARGEIVLCGRCLAEPRLPGYEPTEECPKCGGSGWAGR